MRLEIASQPTGSPQKLIRFWSSDGRQKREFLSEYVRLARVGPKKVKFIIKFL
jgi:hypothetical protein